MRTKIIFFATCFLLLFSIKINAQTSYNDPYDNQIWASLDVNYTKDKYTIGLEYQQRYWNNAQNLKGHYTSLNLEYKLNKHFDLLGSYRLADRDKGLYHRISLGAQYDQKIWNIKMSTRVLLQNQYQDYTDEINTTSKVDANYLFYRGRIKGSYKISKKIDIYGSVEPIFRVGGVFIVDNWRSQIGITYDITKSLKSDIYFIYREDYAKATYNRFYSISGINLSYKIKEKTKFKALKPTITPEF